jgi:hypothetical protein
VYYFEFQQIKTTFATNTQYLNMQTIEELALKQEATNKTLGAVIHLLEKVNTAVEEGFASVDDRLHNINLRLSNLEGQNGMKGVNAQLGDIKGELQKIQKAYPYYR